MKFNIKNTTFKTKDEKSLGEKVLDNFAESPIGQNWNTEEKKYKGKCDCSKLAKEKGEEFVSLGRHDCPCVKKGILHYQVIGHCCLCGGGANVLDYKLSSK
jgi:hypothetical protein